VYVDYAGLRVTDLDRSLRFYTGALGLVELRRGTTEQGGIWVLLEDSVSHQRLELNWYPKGSPYATPYVAGEGFDHLGVRVQDIRAAEAKLLAAGATLAERFEDGGKLVMSYLRDPDGNWIELLDSPLE
jgi:lactoylglutathione lyase